MPGPGVPDQNRSRTHWAYTPGVTATSTAAKASTVWKVQPSIIAIAIMLTSCATSVSRLYPYHVPADSLRLAEVMAVATRDQIAGMGSNYDLLLASGIKPSELTDGSVAVARTYCCGGPSWAGEQGQAMLFYVPSGMKVDVGDIVEIRMGRLPNGDRGRVNTLTRIRQKPGDGDQSCRWDPPNPALWERILYCDWMQQEGWVKQTGVFSTWYKPPP